MIFDDPTEALDAFNSGPARFPDNLIGIRGPLEGQESQLGDMLMALGKWQRWRVRNENVPAPGVGIPQGVLLTGMAGQGKTALATLVAKFGATQGIRPGFLSAREVGIRLKGLPSEREDTLQDYAKALEACDLAVLDDVGTEKGTKDAEQLVHWIVDNAQSTRQFVILTTNLNEEDLLDFLGDERQWSRLLRYTRVSFGEAPDRRRG